MSEPTHSDQFKLSITKALGDQLDEALKQLKPAPLTPENIHYLELQASEKRLNHRSGVYQLYRKAEDRSAGASDASEQREEFIYVGKADSLSDRLSQHYRKLTGRHNIDMNDISFTALFVEEDFSALAPERLLINKHRDTAIAWNNIGFGPKDPGRNRDKTKLKDNHFDVQYPINLDITVSGLHTGHQELPKYLDEVKKKLPYNFRFQSIKKQQGKPLRELMIEAPASTMTADEVFRLISTVIPEGWKISALMGYVIMYPDNPETYNAAIRYYHHGGHVEDATPLTAPPGLIEDDNEE